MMITYRVTETGKKSITDFPWINSNFNIGEIGTRNDLEITRLLENTHYPHIVKTLRLIDKYGSNSEEIGESLLVCNDSFVFRRFLLSYTFLHFCLTGMEIELNQYEE